MFVAPHRVGGESDDGQAARGRIGFKGFGGAKPIHAGQTQIHQHQVRQNLSRQPQPFFRRWRRVKIA